MPEISNSTVPWTKEFHVAGSDLELFLQRLSSNSQFEEMPLIVFYSNNLALLTLLLDSKMLVIIVDLVLVVFVLGAVFDDRVGVVDETTL